MERKKVKIHNIKKEFIKEMKEGIKGIKMITRLYFIIYYDR